MIVRRFAGEYIDIVQVRKLWEAGTGGWEGKGPGDCYGVEHLCRLIGMGVPFIRSLPELTFSLFHSQYARMDCTNQHGRPIGW
jgi:hypothetical protein